jgi:hypothetical protein
LEGDDDEEKLTPQHNLGRQTLSEERIQELKLIKNIQNEQADLLGYVLEDDDDGFYTGLGSIQQVRTSCQFSLVLLSI